MRIFEELGDGKRGLIQIGRDEVERMPSVGSTLALRRYLAQEAQLAGLVPETCEIRETPWLPFAYVVIGEIAPQFSPGA